MTDLNMLSSTHSDLLIKITNRYPQSLDSEALHELNRLMAFPPVEFRRQRSSRHTLKIAYSQYLIQRDLIQTQRLFPEKRHLRLRIIKGKLQFLFGTKQVLGLILGFCSKERYEILDESHILKSASRYLPNVRTVKRSFYSYHDFQENLRLLYVELEKTEGIPFSEEELTILKQKLPQELENRVEKLVPSLFTTQNEEELIKNILILGRELKYVNELPQAMIFFEEQLNSALIFSVIIARIVKENVKTSHGPASFDFEGQAKCLFARSQRIGYLRKSYLKEALILRLEIPKLPHFFRTDSSINLYLAREKVAALIEQKIGEFRDYNGGIILKRQELIAQLKQIFNEEIQFYPDLLENIFYSITPTEMQVLLPLKTLEVFLDLFFKELQQSLSKPEDYLLKIHEEQAKVFIIIRGNNPSLNEYLSIALKSLTSIAPSSLISISVSFQRTLNLGYIYHESCLKKRKEFLHAMRTGIQTWYQSLQNTQVLRLSVLNLPISLDPRLGGDEQSCNLLRMLFEGLMRIGPEGDPVFGIAESVTTSTDLKLYLFSLRESYWSNGQKLTAHDFEYAWKKALSPDFKTPFASLLYPIKNARLAKQNKMALEEVGIKALNDKTLMVELEQPTPYFLELLAHTQFSPINPIIDQMHPDWSILDGNAYVCNGPFCIEKHSQGYSYELVGNDHYWDKKRVNLKKIFIFKLNPYAALEKYLKNELDWLGRPFGSWEDFFSEQITGLLFSSHTRGIYWLACNTESFPFNNLKVRQALAYAINREKIIKTLSYDGLAGKTPLPLIHTFNLDQGLPDGNEETAKKLFQEALKELGLQPHQFPVFTLIHINRGIKFRVAQLIQQQWKEVLGVQCRTEGCEWKTLFSKMIQGDYEMAGIAWLATIDHPFYTLETFKSKKHPFNFTKWNHPVFEYLLNQTTASEEQFTNYLAQAEKILINEVPIIPIFYEYERHAKKEHLKGVSISKISNIDFKSAYILNTLEDPLELNERK